MKLYIIILNRKGGCVMINKNLTPFEIMLNIVGMNETPRVKVKRKETVVDNKPEPVEEESQEEIAITAIEEEPPQEKEKEEIDDIVEEKVSEVEEIRDIDNVIEENYISETSETEMEMISEMINEDKRDKTLSIEEEIEQLLEDETDDIRINLIFDTIEKTKRKSRNRPKNDLDRQLRTAIGTLIHTPKYKIGGMYGSMEPNQMKIINKYFETEPHDIFPSDLLKLIPDIQLSYADKVEHYCAMANCDLKMELFDLKESSNGFDYEFESVLFGKYDGRVKFIRKNGEEEIVVNL